MILEINLCDCNFNNHDKTYTIPKEFIYKKEPRKDTDVNVENFACSNCSTLSCTASQTPTLI